MVERLGKWVDNCFNLHKGYLVRCWTYALELAVTIGILSYLFDNWYMGIIGQVIISIIRFFTAGFHCHKLENCVLLTNILFLVFGFCAKQSVDSLWVVFLITVFCVKDIWIKSPLEINFEDKSKEWHRIQLGRLLFCLFIIICICLYFNYLMIVSTILWSLIMVDALLFLNDLEKR